MTKKKKIIIWLVVILLGFIIMSANTLLTNLTENTNVVCKGEKFSSAEEALKAYEASEREANDESLDYCPPYELLYEFDYDENTIIFYSYCETFDGEKSQECAVRILKKIVMEHCPLIVVLPILYWLNQVERTITVTLPI